MYEKSTRDVGFDLSFGYKALGVAGPLPDIRYDGTEGELYNLREDPLQWRNLWNDAGVREAEVRSGRRPVRESAARARPATDGGRSRLTRRQAELAPALEAAAGYIVETILSVLHGYGLDRREGLHAIRALRSTVHGFAAIEIAGGFGIPLDVDKSFEWLVSALLAGLSASRSQRSS